MSKLLGKAAKLHVFVDASQLAYAAVLHLQIKNNEVKIILAKARVAPVKTVSIPRLELLAMLIGIRLATFFQKSVSLIMHIEKTYVWSDSKCVLH